MSVSVEREIRELVFGTDKAGAYVKYTVIADELEDISRADFVIMKLVSGKFNEGRLPGVEKVIFNGPATIVLWADETKTVVKSHGEPDDREKALMACAIKKMLGNYTRFEKPFREWIGG